MINEQDFVGFAINPVTGKRAPARHFARVAEWEPDIFMHEEGQQVGGGANAIDNLPLNQLANRSEWLKAQLPTIGEILNFLLNRVEKLEKYAATYSPDGAKKVGLQMSRDKPTLDNVNWIPTDSDEIILDPDIKVTLESGDVISLLDSGINCTVDGKIYTFSSSTEMSVAAADVTVPTEWFETIPPYVPVGDTVPAYIPPDTVVIPPPPPPPFPPIIPPTIMPDSPVTVESDCDCEHNNISIADINQSIDNFVNNLGGANND